MMINKIVLTLCCLFFSVIASAQASGGQITRKKSETKKHIVLHKKSETNSQKVIKQDASSQLPQEADKPAIEEKEIYPKEDAINSTMINFSDMVEHLFNDIYMIKVKRVFLERGGNTYELNKFVGFDCGCGFVANGRFFTARYNILCIMLNKTHYIINFAVIIIF